MIVLENLENSKFLLEGEKCTHVYYTSYLFCFSGEPTGYDFKFLLL